jgi:hypothetical protein
MSVTAAQLSKSGAKGKDLDGAIREQIQIIDDKLLKADKTWGRNVLTCSLPVDFSILGLTKKDAQRIMYSSILRNLDKRGFETRIILEDHATTLFIAWKTDLDTAEIEAMNSVIRNKRLLTQADVDKFVNAGEHKGRDFGGKRSEQPKSDTTAAEAALLGHS